MVLDILRNSGCEHVVGFIDSDPAMRGRRIDGIEVLGTPADLLSIGDATGTHRAIVAIGDNGVRRAFADRLESLGFELINAIHPSANLAGNVTFGTNVVVAAGALVCAHCQIGDSVILNTGCIVDHEAHIGTASHICPGARLAGRVTVDSGAFVGIGATIIQGLRIGCEATVGAGAVVIADVAPLSTVVGVPAREIKAIQKEADMHAWLVPEFAAKVHHDRPIPAAGRYRP